MDQEEKNKKDSKENSPGFPGKKGKFNFYWIYGILLVVFIGMQFIPFGDSPKPITWGELRALLTERKVAKILIVKKEVSEVFLKPDTLTEKGKKDARSHSTRTTEHT